MWATDLPRIVKRQLSFQVLVGVGEHVVRQTAIGAAIGAAGGAVVGLLTGDAGMERVLAPPLERRRDLYEGSLEQPVPNQTPRIKIL